MKKQLVFHFYCDYGWEENIAVKLHLECIKHYIHVFDDVVVVIATDHIEDRGLLRAVREHILSYMDCNTITIKTVQNTEFREAKTFYDEIVNKDYDGITLFTHTKGYTNFDVDRYDKERLKEWVICSYWINLNFVHETESMLSYNTKANNGLFYGAFLSFTHDSKLLKKAAYSGSMFWTNMRNVRVECGLSNVEIPAIATRMSAEQFPGLVCYGIVNMLATSHKGIGIYADLCDFYGEKEEKYGPKFILEDLFPEEIHELYEFEDEIHKKSGV